MNDYIYQDKPVDRIVYKNNSLIISESGDHILLYTLGSKNIYIKPNNRGVTKFIGSGDDRIIGAMQIGGPTDEAESTFNPFYILVYDVVNDNSTVTKDIIRVSYQNTGSTAENALNLAFITAAAQSNPFRTNVTFAGGPGGGNIFRAFNGIYSFTTVDTAFSEINVNDVQSITVGGALGSTVGRLNSYNSSFGASLTKARAAAGITMKRPTLFNPSGIMLGMYVPRFGTLGIQPIMLSLLSPHDIQFIGSGGIIFNGSMAVTNNYDNFNATGASALRWNSGSSGLNVNIIGNTNTLFNQSGVKFLGNVRFNNTFASSNYTIDGRDMFIEGSPGAAFTITLPSSSSGPGIGTTLIIKDITGNANVNNITIAGSSSELIDGSSTWLLNTAWQSVRLLTNGSQWFTW